jgi:phage baseplate assembly protein W
MTTLKTSRKYDYSDLDLDFLAHPATGDVMKKVGPESIKRSVRNLILTNFYDRPFRPYIGSNAQKILFDNANPLTAGFLKDAIEEVIENYEPRIKLLMVQVKFDYDNNGYEVRLQYQILNTNTPIVTTLFLERIR